MKIRNCKKINNFRVLNLAILVLMAIFFAGVASAQTLGGNALMMKGWTDYSEWFVIITLYPSVVVMLFIALSLHIARPMVVRYLNRMTLRLGADILWEAWIIGRDVMILAAVGLIGVFIVPRIQSDWYTGVLIPAFVLGIITLVVKLVWDTDASKAKYALATGLTALTLVAALVPYAISPVWEGKGTDFMRETYMVPLANMDTIKDVNTVVGDAVNAAQKGDNSTALIKAQEAEILYGRLNGLDDANATQVQDAFTSLKNAAKSGDVSGMQAARSTITLTLDKYDATLGVLS
jgi:hypothetical protein